MQAMGHNWPITCICQPLTPTTDSLQWLEVFMLAQGTLIPDCHVHGEGGSVR